jgi:hypothetical protein
MDTDHVSGAFADEVRAEMARQRVTARAMQDAVGEGLSSSAYQKYFVQKTRAIPSDVQLAVCQVLGVRTSEMWRRAEAGAASADELMAGLSPRNQRIVEETRTRPKGRRGNSAEQPPDNGRSAQTG